jgi:hypothetical protein
MGTARARPWRTLAQTGDHDLQDGLEDLVFSNQRELVALAGADDALPAQSG